MHSPKAKEYVGEVLKSFMDEAKQMAV